MSDFACFFGQGQNVASQRNNTGFAVVSVSKPLCTNEIANQNEKCQNILFGLASSSDLSLSSLYSFVHVSEPGQGGLGKCEDSVGLLSVRRIHIFTPPPCCYSIRSLGKYYYTQSGMKPNNMYIFVLCVLLYYIWKVNETHTFNDIIFWKMFMTASIIRFIWYLCWPRLVTQWLVLCDFYCPSVSLCVHVWLDEIMCVFVAAAAAFSHSCVEMAWATAEPNYGGLLQGRGVGPNHNQVVWCQHVGRVENIAHNNTIFLRYCLVAFLFVFVVEFVCLCRSCSATKAFVV